jgi:hypothetical protein
MGKIAIGMKMNQFERADGDAVRCVEQSRNERRRSERKGNLRKENEASEEKYYGIRHIIYWIYM